MYGNPSKLLPSVAFGPSIEGLPSDIAEAYQEARNCMGVSAYVATELICRKLLMHIAVDKGATEGETFQSYLDFLIKEQHITPNMKGWADLIRTNANEATHTLANISRQRAETTVMFTAELLRLIYEMEFIKNKFMPPPATT